MIAVMRDIAEGEGDLTKNIYLTSKDELGELSKWFDMFMDNIQEDITQIGKSTHQIAAAAEQQTAVAEEINRSVTSIRDIADQSATAMDETAASSIQLAELGRELQGMARQFHLA